MSNLHCSEVFVSKNYSQPRVIIMPIFYLPTEPLVSKVTIVMQDIKNIQLYMCKSDDNTVTCFIKIDYLILNMF